MQVKYRESGKKEAGLALYHLLPETADTLHAKHMSEIQSEVLAPPTQLPCPPYPDPRLRPTALTLLDCIRRSTGRTGRSWPTHSSP